MLILYDFHLCFLIENNLRRKIFDYAFDKNDERKNLLGNKYWREQKTDTT